MPKHRIALLGLGLMGTGMARRLLGGGFPLCVWNRSAERAAALAGEGATVATSPRQAAQNRNIVISMLADDAASRATWLGDAGALAGVAPATILVECSTLSVDWVNELASLAKEKGCELLDAPVTGSKPQAAAGELNFLVGGSNAALETVCLVLEVMAKSITHLGPTGSGALVKLINNFVCAVQGTAIAEAIAMIERSDLDRDKALAVLTNGAPGSPLVKTLSARMTAHEFTPNFLLRLMAKDVMYAQTEAGKLGQHCTTAAAALDLFNKSIQAGDGEKDFSAVIEAMRK